MPEDPRLEEQAISRAVQVGLSSQLDTADDVTVDVRTDLLKAIQGKVDSISISGQNITLKEIRVEALDVQTDSIAFNPLNILSGKLEPDDAVNATVRVVLTEADVNQAVNAAAIATKIPPLTLNVEGETVTVKLQHPLEIKLPEGGKVALTGKALLSTPESNRQVGFSAVIMPRTNEHPVLMEAFQCQPGNGLSIEFIIALMQRFKALLDLPYMEIEGMAFRIESLDVQPGQLVAEVTTHISQIPSL